MADVDTSIYSNLQNPQQNQENLIATMGGMQNMMIRGVQLGAQRTVGNALLKNTDPTSGQVDTQGFMSDAAASGNPYAAQQAAELAQNLKMKQTAQSIQQMQAQQEGYKQLAQDVYAMSKNTGDSDIAGHAADMYSTLMQDPNAYGGVINKSHVLQVYQQLQGIPQGQRAAILNQMGDRFSTMGGVYPQVQNINTGVGTSTQAVNPMTGEPTQTAFTKDLSPTPQTGTNAKGQTVMGAVPKAATVGLMDTGTGMGAGGMPPTPQNTSVPTLSPNGSTNTPASANVPPPPMNPDDVIAKSASPTGKAAPASPTGPSNPPMWRQTEVSPTDTAMQTALGNKFASANANALTAQKTLTALDAAKTLVEQSDVSGPVRASLLKMTSSNPGLSELLQDPNNLAKAQELQKYLANAVQNQGGGTDEERALISSANPDVKNLRAALLKNIDYQRAMANIPISYQNAASKVQASGGNQQQFDNDFTANADPRIFQAREMDSADRQQFFKNLPPADRQTLGQKYQKLQALGAFDE